MKTKIQAVREFKCQTQAEFADSIGITQACLSQIENGKRQASSSTIAAIQKATNLSFELLKGEVELPEIDFYLLLFEQTLKKCSLAQINAITTLVEVF